MPSRRALCIAAALLSSAPLAPTVRAGPSTATATRPAPVDPVSLVATVERVRYHDSVSPILEVRKATSGHLLVNPRINGQDVGWFILDSGAGIMCIDRTHAANLNLPKQGNVQATGIGGSENTRFVRVERFELGPVEMDGVRFIELDLAAIGTQMGVEVAGVVGSQFFRSSIVQVDFGRASASAYNPSTFELKDAAWQELTLRGAIPMVQATFEGDRRGLFKLDTGANQGLIFHSPTVRKYDLLANRELADTTTGGVGGRLPAKRGAIAYFEVGGKRFENPEAVFSQAERGALAEASIAGNIGRDLLQHFVMTFDYANHRVAFTPHE